MNHHQKKRARIRFYKRINVDTAIRSDCFYFAQGGENMAKLRVIKNMFDTKCSITRRVGDVFIVEDKKRLDELLKSKVVEVVKENSNK